MYILALESTARAASAAICQDGHVLASMQTDNGKTHSEQLLPMAESCLARTGLAISHMDAFACTVGPGSFTGVRIGVGMIKGLAFGTNKPCVAVSTLQAIAEGLSPLAGIYCAVMDARRSELYTALFSHNADGTLCRLTEDAALSTHDLVLLLQNLPALKGGASLYLAGDGYDVAAKALSEVGISFAETPLQLRLQHASAVARCAYQALQNHAACVTESQHLSPTYLRIPQAERERLAKLSLQQ